MLKLSLIGILLVGLTVTIQAYGTTYWVQYLRKRYVQDDGRLNARNSVHVLVATGLVLVSVHIVQIVLWAVTYRVLIPAHELATLETAVYFSFVTFTTLGYGDITLSEGWRLLSGIEAMNGILLIGWSTAILFAIVQRMWQGSGASKFSDQ